METHDRPSVSLTVDEFAREIRVSAATVRRWVREGHVFGVKPGGDRSGYRIPASEADRLLGRSVNGR